MKLTWFGDQTFRIHLGGQIVVIGAETAPWGIDSIELTSGADHVVPWNATLAGADPMTWRSRPSQRLLDAGTDIRLVEAWTIGRGSLLLDADDERPLLILTSAFTLLGRWANSAVAILAGSSLVGRAEQLMQTSPPRLIALAGSEPEIDAAFAALRDKLDGTGLVALEPGLAVEV